tara:strand:+ start:286 stop:561 length:276 start_codon:yes stop_codon:yes gene_type:complete
MKKLQEALLVEINKGDTALIVCVKHNKKATIYKYEVYWFNTNSDYDELSNSNEQEFNTRLCDTITEAYAYGFDAIQESYREYPNIRIKIIV